MSSLTGCHTTSQFAGIGKQSAWKTFKGCSSGLFQHLGDDGSPDERVLTDAEAFVCQLYNKSIVEVLVNKERTAAFRKAKKNPDVLPSTHDALNLHIRRANYQTMISKKALEPCPTLPTPEESGWYSYDKGV